MNNKGLEDWFQQLTSGVPKRITKKLLINYVIWTSVFIVLSGTVAVVITVYSKSDDTGIFSWLWVTWSGIIAYGNYQFLEKDFKEEREKFKTLGQ